MKKWFRFFSLSFFSHSISKESVKRGYTNVFLGFILALTLLFTSFIGAEMLPFGTQYKKSPDFMATAHAVLANSDADKRILAEISDGDLKVKDKDGKYLEGLLVNTFESESDRNTYSVGGYNVIVDLRPADTLAEFEAYCVSNDGKNTEISYEDYLSLSDVARLNFDFKLRYTGRELVLSDELINEYRAFVDSFNDESKTQAESIANDLSENKITKAEYNRGIYQLYFTNYYPKIEEYESSSKVPLLRNYYYHQYLNKGEEKYLFIFDDCIAGSFETKGGVKVSFYGFFADMERGVLIENGLSQSEADAKVDSFINGSFRANWFLNVYAHLVNIITLAPFIALMLLVATLLGYSVLKLCGVESISSLGAMIKIVGSFTWFSGAVSAVLSVILSFFVNRSLITALPTVMFFAVLIIRSIVFVIMENKLCVKRPEQDKDVQTEV